MVTKYRIEAGTGDHCAVGQVDVADGKIAATPPIWRRFIGQPLYRLTWWLTAKYTTCRQIFMDE